MGGKPWFNNSFGTFNLFEDYLCLIGIIPEFRGCSFFFEVLYQLFFGIDVKDTPVGYRCVA